MSELITESAELSEPQETQPVESSEMLVEEDLLVEDVSIDGMCGVY